MKKFALLGALIIALSGCASTNDDATINNDAAAAVTAITAAEVALKKARSVEGEWHGAKKKLVKKAKSAASKGDYKTAVKLANQAKFQGKMGYQQSMEQKNAGPWLF